MKPPRNKKGQFIKGYHYSPTTEFKKGEHWRQPKLFWNKEWLETEYLKNNRSANEIARQFGITGGSIIFWLRKHQIPRRSMSEIRKVKYWGLKGEKNGMYGRRGRNSPNWQGGKTPIRQAIYTKSEWKKLSKEIRNEAKNICEICEKNKGEEIHHLLPVSSFPEYIMEKWNLVLICKPCHKKLTIRTYRINSPEDLRRLILEGRFNPSKKILSNLQ